uniref:Uncharacterized protein n=1 Tax=Setaria viridis TaxID=4556 RepID=A0A4U6TNB2_SETVI|nr:hypothetical protein SEVIR_7G089150v2 [Setaria viridis]
MRILHALKESGKFLLFETGFAIQVVIGFQIRPEPPGSASRATEQRPQFSGGHTSRGASLLLPSTVHPSSACRQNSRAAQSCHHYSFSPLSKQIVFRFPRQIHQKTQRESDSLVASAYQSPNIIFLSQ